MKICVVTTSFTGGGAERVAVNLANYYAENGHDVYLIAFMATGPYISQIANSVTVIDLKGKFVFLKLLFLLRRNQPDFVLSVVRHANIFVGFATLLLKAKIVYREANTMNAIENLSLVKRVVYKLLMKLAYARANKIIANSEDTRSDLAKHNIVAISKCTVIGNPVLPINLKDMLGQELQHEWFMDKELKVILSVGRLHPVKNHVLLIKAFAKVSEIVKSARLVILGEGEEYSNLIDLAKKLKIDGLMQIIKFQQNPYPYYKNADVFVLTSNWEGFGNVIVEAMACGTPVISTDCPGGPSTILDGGNLGVLIPVNDEKALVEGLLTQLTTPQCRDKTEQAQQKAFEYAIPSIAQRYLDVVNSI